ncbi:MAG: hypothetical protein JO163_17120 [Methylobacteriaceae bacterium]|nr:hypothetical protein [Methylobacteriaceae bacterium]
MRLLGFGAALIFLALSGIAPAQALWCWRADGHGRCLACTFDDYVLTLRPGQAVQPLVCENMARDPRVTLVIGGSASLAGPNLHDRVGLRIIGKGRSARFVWGPGVGALPLPIGPVSVPIGPTRDGGKVAPVIQLTTCRSAAGGSGECTLVITGSICVSGQC